MGGVETFARSLELVFEHVLFMTPASADFARVRRERLPLICDNQWLRHVPSALPAIGFQHGMAAEKVLHSPNLTNARMAWQQLRVAQRPRTLWVACAEWIGRRFGELHGNRAAHVIYHMVDLERFDGRRDEVDSQLVLHDARSTAKGLRQIEWLASAFPQYRFEPLACKPSEVPERMRTACAFVHLSRYEGNSIVCNEAMASDLPCFLTRVGLLRDAGGPSDVVTVDPAVARRSREQLIEAARGFFASVETRRYHPRAWMVEHTSFDVTRDKWQLALRDLDRLWDA